MRARMFLPVAWLCVVSAAVAADKSELQRAFLEQHRGARFFTVGESLRLVYGPNMSLGASALESADAFVEMYAPMFGVDPADLKLGRQLDGLETLPLMYEPQTDSYKFTLVHYAQSFRGIPVYDAELLVLVRHLPGFPVVLVNPYVRDLGDFELPTAPRLEDATFEAFARAEVGELVNFTRPRDVIWAGIDDMVVEPRLAVEIIGDNEGVANQEPHKWRFIMDATTGDLLHSENLIYHAEVFGTITGNATQGWGADICGAETAVPLPYIRVTVGSTDVYADANGVYRHDPGGSAVNVTSRVGGRYFVVNDQGGPLETLTKPGNPPQQVDFLHNAANSSEFIRAQVNGYLHANIVRDFTLRYHPTYPVIANQTNFAVNVNIASTCNAFYNGSSINFYRAGGSCPNTAFSTVVHHEYGHHLVQSGGSGQGAYGEGIGDVMGVLISDDPILAYGFQGNCNAGIRNANNTIQYPCSGEIHFCGQLISGCVWSTRTELRNNYPNTYRDIISALAVNSIPIHRGSGIDPSITITFLELDDDDGDIGNGTPHYPEIAAGFGAHNMDAPPLQLLDFNYPNGLPASVDPAGGTTVRVEVLPLSQDPQPGSGRFFVDTGSGFAQATMNQISDNVYDAVFPASTCGDTVRFYFQARTTGGQIVNDPQNAPSGSYSALSAVGLDDILVDNFETDTGWTVQNQNLTTGAWVRAVPSGDGSRGDPTSDYDGSGRCYVTGNTSQEDVDGGPTILTSPAIDMSDPSGEFRIGYARWFTNDDGDDRLIVEVSNGGAWVQVENLGSFAGWVTHSFSVSDYVTPSATVRVRFTTSDNPNNSVTEAAIDAFSAVRVVCDQGSRPGDMNCDGNVDAGDIEGFILALFDPAGYQQQYPDCDINNADVNGDGQVNSGDIEGFIALLFG